MTTCHPQLQPCCSPAPLLLVVLLTLLATVAGNDKLAGSWTIDTPLDSAYNYLFHAEHTGASLRTPLSAWLHHRTWPLPNRTVQSRACLIPTNSDPGGADDDIHGRTPFVPNGPVPTVACH